MWTRAQHDTCATLLLVLPNAAAHALATTGASNPQAWAVPLALPLCPRVLLYYMGALVLDPHKGLDATYHQGATDAYFAGPRQDLLRPAAGEVAALVENAAVPALAVKRAYAYQFLEWQSQRDHQLPTECPFCGSVWQVLHHHIRGRCPSVLTRLLHAQATDATAAPGMVSTMLPMYPPACC